MGIEDVRGVWEVVGRGENAHKPSQREHRLRMFE